MKNLNIIQSGKPSAQWQSWIQGLDHAGFVVRTFDHLKVDPYNLSDLYSDAILLDGMLPQLPKLIASICSRNPEVQIVVATEIDSFTIYYEVLHLNGAIYISGPLPADQFAETIHTIMANQKVA